MVGNTRLLLGELPKHLHCISHEFTAILVQACVVRLHEQGHHGDNIFLEVVGKYSTRVEIVKPYPATDKLLRTWTEHNYTTDHAACAVALNLICELTELTVISRSWTKTGFDYWLGPKDSPCDINLPFDNAVRLEISGIRKGSDYQINKRIDEKITQTNQSDNLGLPAYIVVTEFSTPKTKFVEKQI